MPVTPVTVLLVDDEPLVRAGLRAVLEAQPDIEVCGEAADGAAVIPLVRRLRPDVVAMDVRMPLLDGIEATRAVLRTVADPPKILVITTFENDEYVYEALRAGADGFLLKRARPAEIVHAVRLVAEGESLLLPASVRQLAAEYGDGGGNPAARALLERATLTGRDATVALGGGRGAVQVAQEFSDTEDLLRELQQRTVLLVSAVVVAAGVFGWWLARRITRRLVRLAGAAEDVARTGRLGIQVPVTGHDEVARLGRSFDRMLGRLARSEEDQRRLVQDAGHELRTPLTSLRTNISMLRRIDELPPAAREELVADLALESRELTDLVNELVELAAGQSDTEPVRALDLAETAEDVAVLARRRTGRDVTVHASGDTRIGGRPAALQRALSNLVENAAKFDPDGEGTIEIVVEGRPVEAGGGPGEGPWDSGAPHGTVRVEVRDRGPGIAEGDRTRVFDRFYRAADARSRPGSG
ncbi:response regulator, partial [Streptomyces sp. NPDC005568]|uniref:response regulator n=1 Tax=Streptomyces sp. NPDC005568 TaxID=3156887 RepID=UPI0033B6DC01